MSDDNDLDRRSFLRAAGAMAAVAVTSCRNTGAARTGASTASPAGRLPLGFSTLGSPKWDWIQTLDFAAAHGFAAVELRGLQQTMDLSQRPEFQPDRVADQT